MLNMLSIYDIILIIQGNNVSVTDKVVNSQTTEETKFNGDAMSGTIEKMAGESGERPLHTIWDTDNNNSSYIDI